MSVTISGSGQIVKQLVTATDSTNRSTTSSSPTWVTASNTLSVTITPTNASNKVYIVVTASVSTSTANSAGYFTIFRNGSTNLGSANNGMTTIYGNGYGANTARQTMSISFLDSPATTSATTYQLYFCNNTVGTIQLQVDGCTNSSITAMEIAYA